MERIKSLFCINALATHHNLLRHLVHRDLMEKLKGSSLGAYWSIIQPLLLIAVYLLVFSHILGIRHAPDQSLTDYGLYLVSGLVVFLPLQEALLKATDIILKYRHLLNHVSFPSCLLPLHLAITAGMRALLLIVLFSALRLVFYAYVDFHGGQILFLLLCYVLFLSGLCMFIASLCVLKRDWVQIVQALAGILFFLSPIVYPLSQVPPDWIELYSINPITQFVLLSRASLGLGDLLPVYPVWLLALSLCLFCLGNAWYASIQSKLTGQL